MGPPRHPAGLKSRVAAPAGHIGARLGARRRERFQHTLFSLAIATMLALVAMLDPVDQFLWMLQGKIAERQPSGDIVFVESKYALDDPSTPQRRIELARTLEALDQRGVAKVYIDVALSRPSSAAADARLASAIAAMGRRVVLVDQIERGNDGAQVVRRTLAPIAGKAARVLDDKQRGNYLGFVWDGTLAYRDGARTVLSFEAAMANVAWPALSEFPIEYGFRARSLPSVHMDALANAAPDSATGAIDVAGLTAVIGDGSAGATHRQIVPNAGAVPPSFVAIYGAETLKARRTHALSMWQMLLVTATLLAGLVLAARGRQRRWLGYGAAVGTIPALLVLGSELGVRIEASYSLALLGIYGLFRWRSRWKQRVALVNQETGLSTLRALETRLARERIGNGHVVIAKIQNYEQVIKSLSGEHRADYLLRLVDRLRAADPSLTIYHEGHHLAWHSTSDETDALVEHLEGLRAIFAAPIQVSGHSVDVGITFGLAALEGEARGRLPAALAAAEETSEANCPICLADGSGEGDLLWDISLRARIDEAMEAGEIYCVYQPKVDLASGDTSGVEALVRWHDPARGFIDPMHFVRQCEKAGRMEHLTRYVLQSACSAGQLLHFRGQAWSMAVNISATMLTDMRIVGIVRNVLQATRFDPRALVLEVTETARIADLEVAARILAELRTLGTRISIDDFGVGAANLETFHALPFDELKIDRLFISGITESEKDRAIVSSMIAMGREARIAVVAEGVETVEEVRILRSMGCQTLQGYAFSRPVSLSNLLDTKPFSVQERQAHAV